MSGTARSKVVLDIGCGAGWLLSQARKRWPAAKLRGGDPADKGLEAARRVVPDAMLVLAPAGFLPSWWNAHPRSELQDLGRTLGRAPGDG